MKELLKEFPGVKSVVSIISTGGGKVVGRTRLQKIAYLLNLAGIDPTFEFEYKHYGPFSADLAQSVDFAKLASLVSEESKSTSWGGFYSVFSSDAPSDNDVQKKSLIDLVINAESVVLELAATAAFLHSDFDDPWLETARRKPNKATTLNISKAKDLYRQLQQLETPQPFPLLVN